MIELVMERCIDDDAMRDIGELQTGACLARRSQRTEVPRLLMSPPASKGATSTGVTGDQGTTVV